MSVLEFVFLQSLLQNGSLVKILKFQTKNAWFGHFWTGSWKLYCHIWSQHPPICLIAKLCEKMKMPKFETKNAFFDYFWAWIWKWYCHIWNQHRRICLTAKFRGKTKTPKFAIKNALFGYFSARISKNYCHIWNQLPQIFSEKQKCLNVGSKMPYLGIVDQKYFI